MIPDSIRFASSITDEKNPAAAAESVLKAVAGQLGGAPAHAAFLFVSASYKTDWEPILRKIRQELGNPLLLGCTGGGILGGDQELEFTPALSLAAAHLPRVELYPFTVSPEDLEEPRGPGFWIEKLGCLPAEEPAGILLPDPFSCDSLSLLGGLNQSYPKMPLVGGLASGGDSPGSTALFLNDQVITEGAVGTLLTGDIQLQTIVSQGCRPIGRPAIVTKAQDNAILELAGLPTTKVLQKLFASLPAPDQALARRALFLGVVMNEQKETFRRGDFLIRNLVGLDPASGALFIGDRIQVGQTVQFQLRDGDTAREDLRRLLEEHSKSLKRPPAGGLLFSCLGRGRDLYGEPHHDIRTIQSCLGETAPSGGPVQTGKPVPIAGFFCNGEIGPIGGRLFLHGFTSSLGLFLPRT
ncbi:MAG: FIST C-terminal domain-containing protein [Candidatus Omnitrophica bacterium]|nr:FIST C-terminal domain-containing protein [Candidatus Omnitrophota bacterium]